jgi:hypothetical protein
LVSDILIVTGGRGRACFESSCWWQTTDSCLRALMFSPRYLAHEVENLGAETWNCSFPRRAPSHVLSLCYTSTHARPICDARLWASLLAAFLPAKPASRPSLIASHLGPRCPVVYDHTLPRLSSSRPLFLFLFLFRSSLCYSQRLSKAAAGLFRTIVPTARNHRRTCPSLLRPAPTLSRMSAKGDTWDTPWEARNRQPPQRQCYALA